jgi:hypothetical protein
VVYHPTNKAVLEHYAHICNAALQPGLAVQEDLDHTAHKQQVCSQAAEAKRLEEHEVQGLFILSSILCELTSLTEAQATKQLQFQVTLKQSKPKYTRLGQLSGTKRVLKMILSSCKVNASMTHLLFFDTTMDVHGLKGQYSVGPNSGLPILVTYYHL